MDLRSVAERMLPQVEKVLARLLEFDRATQSAIAALEGNVIALELGEAPHTLYVLPDRSGLAIRLEHSGEVHVRVRGTVADFLALARHRLEGEPPPAGLIEIQGDLRTAQQVQEVLARLNIDWEEMLSRAVGDIAAHKLANAGRELWSWLQSARASLETDVSEYMRYETGMLPDRHDVERYAREIDALRAHADRIAERVRRFDSLLRVR